MFFSAFGAGAAEGYLGIDVPGNIVIVRVFAGRKLLFQDLVLNIIRESVFFTACAIDILHPFRFTAGKIPSDKQKNIRYDQEHSQSLKELQIHNASEHVNDNGCDQTDKGQQLERIAPLRGFLGSAGLADQGLEIDFLNVQFHNISPL